MGEIPRRSRHSMFAGSSGSTAAASSGVMSSTSTQTELGSSTSRPRLVAIRYGRPQAASSGCNSPKACRSEFATASRCLPDHSSAPATARSAPCGRAMPMMQSNARAFRLTGRSDCPSIPSARNSPIRLNLIRVLGGGSTREVGSTGAIWLSITAVPQPLAVLSARIHHTSTVTTKCANPSIMCQGYSV